MRGFDYKRTVESVLEELETTAEAAREKIARLLEESKAEVKATAEFWKAPPSAIETFLSKADHVMSFPGFMLPTTKHAQLQMTCWGNGGAGDLYNVKGGEYEVLVIITRKEPR